MTTKPLDHEYDASVGVVFEKQKSSRYLTDKELSDLPLWKRINYLSSTIIFLPLLGLLLGLLFSVKLTWQTFVLAFIQYYLTGMGITAGYHRLWAHRAYEASSPVQWVLALWGAAAFEGSARWWCRNHRGHHRYVDSEKDPYSVHKGFWYAHVGWMVFKQDSRRAGRVDISDLNNNTILQFQHKYYLPIAVFFAFVLPCMLAHYLWDDFWGGFVYAGFGRMFFVHQATFLVNSLAHSFGTQTFSTEHTSYDSPITALLTLGEGYHNYHHEFPHDYRNGIRWYHFDPTKWTVRILLFFRLVSHLHRFPKNEQLKARIQVKQLELDELKKKVDWGISAEKLPEMTWGEIEHEIKQNNRVLIVVNNEVLDVEPLLPNHPGGTKILQFWNGRDATQAFNGLVYKHSKAARNLVPHFRVAKLQEKLE